MSSSWAKINHFTEKLDEILAQISNCRLPCIIAGDINIDLKRLQTNHETKSYVDNLIVHNFTPVVVMPTRLTDRSATIIDHIYYSDCTNKRCTNYTVTGGNLWCDITDHLPNFVFLEDKKDNNNITKNLPFIRLHSPKSIEIFKKIVIEINWTVLYNYDNINEAYNFFHMKITECYDKCFKLVRLSRKCANDKL